MKLSTILLLAGAVISVLSGIGHRAMAQTVVFDDTFSGSTLNSATPTPPTANSTGYQSVSTLPLTVGTIGSGDLNLGVGTTSGNGYQIQALFTTSPITLATVGDYVQLDVSFTDSGGFLTGSNGTLNLGLFNSGGVGPWAGGINNENQNNTTATTGGAQGWIGYVGQVVTNHSYINLRAAQTGPGNNNQDVLFGGGISATKGYNNPWSSLGTNNAGTRILALNGPYTMELTFQLTAPGSLAISNSFYSGSTLLSEFDTVASGPNYLTDSFDGLAFGFYANKNNNTSIELNQIEVTDSIQTVPEPTVLVLAVTGLPFLVARFRKR